MEQTGKDDVGGHFLLSLFSELKECAIGTET
jgi:hypothetical protein